MADFTNNREKRVEDLLAFSRGIMNGENGKELIERYRDAIDNLTPHDLLALEDQQLQMGITPQKIKKYIEKIINTFFKSLEKYPWEHPEDGTFLYHLMQENEKLSSKLQQIKVILKSYRGLEIEDFDRMKVELLPKFKELQAFDDHYVKKENILFPYLEKRWENYRPLSVMWSLHDDIRKNLKNIIVILQDPVVGWEEFNKIMSEYFFLVFGMIQKENLILYPVASEDVLDEEWAKMFVQSFDYSFPFIEAPVKKETGDQMKKNDDVMGEKAGFSSETGTMNYEQVLLVFNHLPVDITFVDENNKVKFFNRAKDRFFPRSPAIIGRDVKNCHPPESVHIVEKIVSEFRSGARHSADFRIKIKGKYLLIQYFAVRNDADEYRGVIEISQDITEINQYSGEKRLLDWE